MMEVRDKALRFRHELVNAESGEIAATSQLTGVHLDTRIRKACSIPEEIAARARALVAGE
jgi:acyl-CoA thioester hydrolase